MSEDEFDGKNRFKVESQLNVKRFLKVKMTKFLGLYKNNTQILLIVLLFLVSASILIVSVLHDVKERRSVRTWQHFDRVKHHHHH